MRVHGENAPERNFTIEAIPKKRGMVLVRFYDNIMPTENGAEWDEYTLELPSYPMLKTDIEANYNAFFRQAQLLDDEKSNSDAELLLEMAAEHEERICMLELFGGEL